MTVPATLPQSQLPTNSADATALQSSLAWALSLTGGERLTAEQAAMVPAAMREIDRQLTPISSKSLAVELAKLMDWGRAFGIPIPDQKVASKAYADGLSLMPADLLEEAMRRAMATHKFGVRLPLPAEIMATVSEEISHRRKIKWQLGRTRWCSVDRPALPSNPEAKRLIAGATARFPTRLT